MSTSSLREGRLEDSHCRAQHLGEVGLASRGLVRREHHQLSNLIEVLHHPLALPAGVALLPETLEEVNLGLRVHDTCGRNSRIELPAPRDKFAVEEEGPRSPQCAHGVALCRIRRR